MFFFFSIHITYVQQRLNVCSHFIIRQLCIHVNVGIEGHLGMIVESCDHKWDHRSFSKTKHMLSSPATFGTTVFVLVVANTLT